MIEVKRRDADRELRLALYVISIVAVALFLVNVAGFLMSSGANRLGDPIDILNDIDLMLSAMAFGAIGLIRISVSRRYRLAMAFVIALVVARVLTLSVSPSWNVLVDSRSQASLPLWSIAGPLGIFVFYSAMEWLCKEFDLHWARARWRTAKCLLLFMLFGLLFYELQDASYLAIPRSSIAATGLPAEAFVYILVGLPFAYTIAAMNRTLRDFPAKKREISELSDGYTVHSRRGLWLILVDEALLLVLVGNSLWATALLLHSAWLFSAGATVVVIGFVLKVKADVLSSRDIPPTAAWIRVAWRPALTLAGLFLLVFVAKPSSVIMVPVVALYSVVVMTNLDPHLFSVALDRGRTENSRSARSQRGLSRSWGITLMTVGWIESIVGLVVIVATLSRSLGFNNLSPEWTISTWLELSHQWGDVDWQKNFRSWFQMLAGAALIGTGQRFRWHARQHLSTIVSALPQDEKFVLYLRSFQDDTKRNELEGVPRLRGATIPMLWLHEYFFSGRSEEEQLIAALKRGKLGPVIAVGAPGEWRPPGGAKRMYLPYDDDWQESVREMMSRARLVVIALGTSAGAMWELVEAMSIVPPERLLLVVPMLEREYEKFREKATEELRARAEQLRCDTGKHWSPPELPEYPRGSKKMYAGVQALVYYLPNWKPVIFALGGTRFVLYDTLTLPLQAGLYPVFKNLAAYEQRGYNDHKRRGIALLIAGQWITTLGLAICVIGLGSPLLAFMFNWKMAWFSLAPWLQLLLAFSAPWQIYYGRMLRLRATYHLTCLKSPGDGGTHN